MNPLSRVARKSIKCFNHHSMKCFSVTTTTTTNSDGKSGGWRLPEKDEDYQRYLMRYENVVGHEFLENMRNNYIKWGFNFTDKQKQGIRNCVGHSSTRVRRALYPGDLRVDPIMKKLLLLTEKDLQFAKSKDSKTGETLKEFRDQLIKTNKLTFKQLQFAGNLLERFFGETENNTKK